MPEAQLTAQLFRWKKAKDKAPQDTSLATLQVFDEKVLHLLNAYFAIFPQDKE
jgi:hypothetical protein